MAMSRKDYVKFAAVLAGELALANVYSNKNVRDQVVATLTQTTRSMADVFEADNSNFDRAHFLAAAGL